MLGNYLSNPRLEHWKAIKRVMWYLHKTKKVMLTYRKYDLSEVECLDNKRSTSGYIFMLTKGALEKASNRCL